MDWKFLFSVLGLAVCLSPVRAANEASALVVVYNAADPTSQALASYYADRRKIPSERVVGIPCALTEEITRQEFQATIADPLRKVFLEKGWWKMAGGRVSASTVRFAVLMRGMPLKIRSDGPGVVPRTDQPSPIGTRDEASVDSELAALGLGEVPAPGLVPNPFYRRFTPILQAITDPGLLLVCRLDAPSDLTVRAMIDDAISVEQGGLWGWGYVDSRSIKDGGYAEGDEWLKTAASEMRKQGIPVLWDKAPETLPVGYPVTDAAVYLGWYADSVVGPFADPNFRFRPGAIAVHIHSFSAATVRSVQGGWCGPLLARGAAVTVGNVYEPYLTLTAHLDVFQDRLMAGFTFAESAYMSLRALSWMNVSIGDPLYRPYAAWQRMQVKVRGEKKDNWQKYRSIVLAADGNVAAAAEALTQAAQATGDSMFLESLAAVDADAGSFDQSLALVNKALAMESRPLVRFRLVLEKIGLLRAMGKISDLRTLLASERGKAPGAPQLQLIDAISLRMFPPPPTPVPAAAKKP